jgi:hypothetical protein
VRIYRNAVAGEDQCRNLGIGRPRRGAGYHARAKTLLSSSVDPACHRFAQRNSACEVHARSPTRASAADQHSRQVGHSHSASVTRARVSCRPQRVVISLPEGRFRSRIPAAWRLPSIGSQKNDRGWGKVEAPGESRCTVLYLSGLYLPGGWRDVGRGGHPGFLFRWQRRSHHQGNVRLRARVVDMVWQWLWLAPGGPTSVSLRALASQVSHDRS